jgi:hypothetical protein
MSFCVGCEGERGGGGEEGRGERGEGGEEGKGEMMIVNKRRSFRFVVVFLSYTGVLYV